MPSPAPKSATTLPQEKGKQYLAMAPHMPRLKPGGTWALSARQSWFEMLCLGLHGAYKQQRQ